MNRRLYFTLALLIVMSTIAAYQPPTSHATTTPLPNRATSQSGHAACAGVNLATPTTPECEAFMASRPTPNVTPIPVDFGIVANEQFIRFNKNNVAVYDAPGGNLVETLVTGYTYFTPSKIEDGWAQIRPDRWVSLEDARYASPSTFSGVTINGALDMPFAWILWRHYPTRTPNGVNNRDVGLVQRYQLVNIYATVNLSGWNWHLIGPNQWVNQKNLSIVYPTAPADFGGRWLAVNLFEQNLVGYEGGAPVMATLISSGLKNGKWDTHEGTFTIGTRLEAAPMTGAEGQADYYSLDKVPYAQYFDGLISLHGTYWHDSFGYPHSHGCVNLTISDAKYLFAFVTEGSTVYVYPGL